MTPLVSYTHVSRSVVRKPGADSNTSVREFIETALAKSRSGFWPYCAFVRQASRKAFFKQPRLGLLSARPAHRRDLGVEVSCARGSHGLPHSGPDVCRPGLGKSTVACRLGSPIQLMRLSMKGKVRPGVHRTPYRAGRGRYAAPPRHAIQTPFGASGEKTTQGGLSIIGSRMSSMMAGALAMIASKGRMPMQASLWMPERL